MKGLWETPSQVRQRIGMQLASGAQMFPNTGVGMMGLALGGAMGGLFSAERNPEIARAQTLQTLQKGWGEKMKGLDMSKPADVQSLSQMMMQDLAGAGMMGEALALNKAMQGFAPASAVSEGTQKAIRDNIVKQRNAQESKASSMVESMTRINSLAGQARKGNRSARGTMVQQVARLAQGAGVITDRDAAAVTGDQNGFAFLLSAIMPNVDVDTQAALRGIDPLGAGFNTDNLLIVADSLLTSGRNSVTNIMGDLRSQASEAQLRPQGIKALFAGTRNIDALNELKADIGGGKNSDPLNIR